MTSWFFNKQPRNVSLGKTPEPAFAIRTMRDDMESIKRGEPEFSPAQFADTTSKPSNTQSIAPATSPSPQTANPPFKLDESDEKVREEERVSQNPFGIISNPAKTQSPPTPSSVPPAQPIIENGLQPIELEGDILVNQKSHRMRNWIITLVIIFIIAATGGIWYFFFGGEEQFYNIRKKTAEFLFLSDISPEVIENIPDISEMTEEETLMEKPFSSDKPNYLPFNTETVSPEDIRATFYQIANLIQDANITEPVEFLVTDQNNNPLASSRFAFLLKLDLDPELLAITEELFSLYAYNDAGSVRFGLVLDFKDEQTEVAAEIIKKTESELPYALRPLILEPNIVVGKKLSFQSSNYNQLPIRFVNIDVDRKIAIDYALYNNQFFMGTSRETLRAILNTLIQAEKK